MVKPAGIPQTPSLVKTYASQQTASSSPSSAIPGEKTQVANIKQPVGGPNDFPVNGLPAETQFKVQQARGSAQPSTEKATVNKPAGNDAKDPNAPVPLAKVAEKFDTTQNGQPVNPAVLAKAAGEDGILTQAEAKQLPDVLCKNKETGEVLPIAECMQKNGVSAIDLGKGAPDEKGGAPVPLAKVAEKFDTTQNGQPVNPAVLAKAAGEDGILTQAEAKQLPDVLCKNKETGEVLPIAECMQKNGVSAIDLGGGAGAPDEKTPQGGNNGNNNNSLVNTTLDALRDLDAPPELIAAYEEQYKLLGLA